MQHFLGSPRAVTSRESKQKASSRSRKNYPHRNDDSAPGKKLTESQSYFRWDSGMKVYISDAWCVGEENYLRAWAYMYSLHGTMERLGKPADWIQSSSADDTPKQWKKASKSSQNRRGKGKEDKSSSPNNDRESGNDYNDIGTSTKSCNMEYYYSFHQGTLDYVLYDDIAIINVLGEGRNGACFKVKWNGVECAMKQFDIGRDGDKYFEKEIRAYMLLRNAWGVLVPRPLFLSESYSGGIMLLGLQLGHESTNDDDDLQKFDDVLHRLATEFGIQHNDAECGRNMIIITDTNGVERVAAIDFENWDEVQRD
jgi:hypothetical protein